MISNHATPDNMSFATRLAMVKCSLNFHQEVTTMPLHIARRQQALAAELHYLIRTAEKPTRYVTEPPAGVPAWNGIDDTRSV
jgi:hypothetical protein